MNATIRKMGNSHGLYINKSILEKLNLKVDDKVELKVKDNQLIISKEKPKNIYDLFREYKDDSIRESYLFDDEIVGNEIW